MRATVGRTRRDGWPQDISVDCLHRFRTSPTTRSLAYRRSDKGTSDLRMTPPFATPLGAILSRSIERITANRHLSRGRLARLPRSRCGTGGRNHTEQRQPSIYFLATHRGVVRAYRLVSAWVVHPPPKSRSPTTHGRSPTRSLVGRWLTPLPTGWLIVPYGRLVSSAPSPLGRRLEVRATGISPEGRGGRTLDASSIAGCPAISPTTLIGQRLTRPLYDTGPTPPKGGLPSRTHVF